MTQRTILVIAGDDDDHASYMRGIFQQLDISAAFVDIGKADTSASLSLTIEGNKAVADFYGLNPSSSDVTIWWRRASRPRVDERIAEPSLIRFTARQWELTIDSFVSLSGARFVNHPLRERIAIQKPTQLHSAAKLGFRVPRTIVTNNPIKAKSFIEELHASRKRCVFKPLWPGHYHFGETRVIETVDGLSDELAVAPVIFQECIEKGRDVRYTIFGENVYAATVNTSATELVDWRIDPLASYIPIDLDREIVAKSRQLLSALGLVTGSFDVRIDQEGQPYFFEVNPSGQFLYLERFGFPDIGQDFARFLVGDE